MKLPLTLAFISVFSLAVSTANAEPLKVGDTAPDVAATTETGAKVNLGDIYKKQPYTLVYFYPRAGTKGCTAQGCSLRDAYEQLTKKGVAVVGVSTDDTAAQEKFKEEQHFPFTLLADPEKNVINAFGVPVTERNSSTYAARQAYLIKDGKIIWADYKAKTDKQAEDVLKVLDEQKG
jgi:thioredoxin-dependent peroxiredoxin